VQVRAAVRRAVEPKPWSTFMPVYKCGGFRRSFIYVSALLQSSHAVISFFPCLADTWRRDRTAVERFPVSSRRYFFTTAHHMLPSAASVFFASAAWLLLLFFCFCCLAPTVHCDQFSSFLSDTSNCNLRRDQCRHSSAPLQETNQLILTLLLSQASRPMIFFRGGEV
jgi:hypothetical protein